MLVREIHVKALRSGSPFGEITHFVGNILKDDFTYQYSRKKEVAYMADDMSLVQTASLLKTATGNKCSKSF